MLSWRQSSYLNGIHSREHECTAAACCSIKLKNEFMWSRIESFPSADESSLFVRLLARVEKLLITIMVSSYRVFLFLFFFISSFSSRLSLNVAFFGGVNPILFGSWEAVGEIGGGGFWWGTYLIPNMFWQIDSPILFCCCCLFVFFFSVVGCFDAVALRLSRPTALIP